MYFNIPLFFIVTSLMSTSLGAVAARSSFDIILARQTASDPCHPICNIYQTSNAACGGNPDCMCNTGTEEVLQDCINCIVAADVSLSVMISGLIKKFQSTCENNAYGLPSLTLNVAGTTTITTSITSTTIASTTGELTMSSG